MHALFRPAVFTLLSTAAIVLTGSAKAESAESAIDAQQPPAGDAASTSAADPAAVALDEETVGVPPSSEPDKTLEFFITGAASKQFDADIDDGGSFDVDRYYVQGGLTLDLNPKTSISMGVGYAYDGYNFDGSTGFGGLRPWENLQALRFGARVRYAFDDQWTVFVAPSIRFATETGVNLGDGVQGGAIVGFSYKFSEKLTLGPGIGVLSQIEDDVSVFPILIVNWKITDTLTIQTGRGLAASQGPGLELAWQFAEDWSLSFGARYEKQRWRLDDSGIAPDGVAEEKSLPLYGVLRFAPSRSLELSFFAGVSFAGELLLENSSGGRISKQDYDAAPFIGVIGTFRF